MRSKLFTLLPLFLLAASTIARADDIETLTASGTFADSATLSGAITLDSTTGVFTAADLNSSSPDSFNYTSIQGQSCPGEEGVGCDVVIDNVSETAIFVLEIDVSSFVGFTGGAIASVSDPIPYASCCVTVSGLNYNTGHSFSFLSSGELVDSSDSSSGGTPGVTPEPSSLLLLGTGGLGLMGVARRQFVSLASRSGSPTESA
jgi:hypothetical protein